MKNVCMYMYTSTIQATHRLPVGNKDSEVSHNPGGTNICYLQNKCHL